jgi:hypothetical protein
MNRFLKILPLSVLMIAVGCAAGGNSTSQNPSGGGGSSSSGNGGSGTGGEGAGFITDAGGPPIDPDAACLTDTFGAEVAPAQLLFQLDVSGSMNCPPTDTVCASADPMPGSRWEVFKSKLQVALGQLPKSNSAGLMHYPTGKGTFSGDPTGCVPQNPDVAIAPLTTSLNAINSALAAIAPAGGTPTHDAITAAFKQLELSQAVGPKYLILATDGQATFCSGCDLFCSSAEMSMDNEKLITEVAAAATNGIRTFVLGAPGSGPYRSILSRIAEAGQTSAVAGCTHQGPNYCHYDMTTAPDFAMALETALAEVGGATLSCNYDIPKDNGSFDPTQVNVQLTVNGQVVQVPQDKSHTDGWDYSPDGKQIVLYGQTCSEAKAAQNGKIDILYGCPTILK